MKAELASTRGPILAVWPGPCLIVRAADRVHQVRGQAYVRDVGRVAASGEFYPVITGTSAAVSVLQESKWVKNRCRFGRWRRPAYKNWTRTWSESRT